MPRQTRNGEKIEDMEVNGKEQMSCEGRWRPVENGSIVVNV